jgi:hypothetical protein
MLWGGWNGSDKIGRALVEHVSPDIQDGPARQNWVDQTLGAVIGGYHQWCRGKQRSYLHNQYDFEIRLCAGQIEDTAKGSGENTHRRGNYDNHVGKGES